MAEWFESFFDGLYGRVLKGTFDDARTRQQVRAVRRMLRPRKGQKVLDVPCGIGRLTLPLAKSGLRMTGVDLTRPFLQRGKKEAARQRLDVRFIHSDMRGIDFSGEFDAAFNWFGSFGYFSDADNLAFCRKVLRALKPGGRFLVEGPNKSFILTHFRPRSDQTINGVRVLQRTRLDSRADRLTTEWTMSRGKRSERCRISIIRIFNGADLRRLLHRAGFRDIRLYGFPPVGRFTRHSRRIVAVGRKPVGNGA